MLHRTVVSLVIVGVCSVASAAETAGPVIAEYRALVPHRLLALLHAPEVHAELQLSKSQAVALEAMFAKVDRVWFPARIQPAQKQLQIQTELELQVQQWLAANLSATQRERLRQLEMQAQSVRMLLRTDLASEMKLTPEQQREFAKLAQATEAAQAELQKAGQQKEAQEALQAKVKAATKAEQDGLKTILTQEQHEQLWKALGDPFPTAKLTRIYPMAPELVKVEHWINSKPLKLSELRGKVVLVHFYAFQCHNCHANFDIYRRWHEQLREKGVVVLGIQTPETTRERDPAAVKAAAAERNLEFPILVDLESENWKAWGNTMWPTVYVVDKNGYLRHWWQGELNWQGATGDKTIESVVETALAEPDAKE
jgi:peroxiredoxin